MIHAEHFIQTLREHGFRLFSGVPCSYLTPLINTVIDSRDVRYVGATNEGDAVAIACGAELGGSHGVVMFQNSGLGNAVSPLTSLTATFQIPVLLITTWRGEPNGPADEPQHKMMGRITPQLLELMGIPWEPFPQHAEAVGPVVARAAGYMRSKQMPYALVMCKGAVAPHELETRPMHVPLLASKQWHETNPTHRHDPDDIHVPLLASKQWHDPDDVLRAIQANIEPSDAVLATTGFTGRALYALDDRPNQMYMVGSMGCVSSLGLGLALAQPQRRVVVIDGDGSLLMRMGALATIGHESPPNLVHIVLDNGVHESTGGQATVSASLNLVALARACGYPQATRIGDLDELGDALAARDQSLKFIHVQTKPRCDRKLPRPEVTPQQVAERFRNWLEQSPCNLMLEPVC